jgi:uncharacterized membrane protein YccC
MSGTPQIAGGASETVRRAAARRAGRTAVVTFAAFSIGRWGAESVPVAVFATFTGLAITGIADFGGPMRGRVGAIAVTVTAGFALTALGTSISTQGVVAGCLMTFCVVAAIALMGLLGGYAVAWSNASILFYVVAIGSPAPVSAIAERLHGVALGGVLALLATVWLWPEQADTQVRHQLAQTLDGLARRLSRIIEQREQRPTTRPVNVRSDLAVLVDRPVAPTGIQRAELYLLNDVERLEGLTGRLETGRPPNHLARTGLASCASALASCSEALSAAADATDAASPLARDASVASGASAFSAPTRLASVTRAVQHHTRGALGLPQDGEIVNAFTTAAQRSSRWREDLHHGTLRLRANLTVRSVHVQDALRLGAGLSLAVAAVNLFALQHGFWVAFATLTVVKTNLRATRRSVGEAIAGTIIGLAAAAALIGALSPSQDWYVLLLPSTVALTIYANRAVSFLAGQAGFTLVIIVLFNLLGPAGWQIGITRLVDVVAGAAAGLLIGTVAWPRGATTAISGAAADLFESAAAYLASTVRTLAGSSAPVLEEQRAVRQSAADAALRADSTLAQLFAEHPWPEQALHWTSNVSAGNRLWYAADLISQSAGTRVKSADAAVRMADRLQEHYLALATSLRDTHAPLELVAPAPTTRGSEDLVAWLDELTTRVSPAAPTNPARPHRAKQRDQTGRQSVRSRMSVFLGSPSR